MPTKKPKSSTAARIIKTTKSANNSLGRMLLIVLAILVGIGVVGLGIRHDNLVRADRARFARAEKDVAELTRNIVAAVGEPLKTQTENFCSRPSVELGYSPLSCSIDKSLFYAEKDDIQANNIFSTISVLATKNWGVKTSTYSSNGPIDGAPFKAVVDNSADLSSNQKVIEKYYDVEARISCDAIYELDRSSYKKYTQFRSLTDSIYIMNISLSCDDRAISQYYPMNH